MHSVYLGQENMILKCLAPASSQPMEPYLSSSFLELLQVQTNMHSSRAQYGFVPISSPIKMIGDAHFVQIVLNSKAKLDVL